MWQRSRRAGKLNVFARITGAGMPNKVLLQAVSIVPWVYAVFWYAATSAGNPTLAWWANWGWIAVIVFMVGGFLAIRAQERRKRPPES